MAEYDLDRWQDPDYARRQIAKTRRKRLKQRLAAAKAAARRPIPTTTTRRASLGEVVNVFRKDKWE